MILKFIKIIFDKSQSHQRVWPFLLSKIEENETRISIFEIISKTKVQKKTIYPILTFGFKYFLENDIGVVFYLENNQVIITPRENYVILDLKTKKPKKVKILGSTIKVRKTTTKAKNEPIILYDFQSQIIEIIEYLNFKALKDFNPDSDIHKNVISDRLIEKFTIEDFKYVIDIKTEQWLNTKEDRYLRPSTLFGPGNMENYVNETSKLIIKPNRSSTPQTHEAAELSKKFIADRRKNQTSGNK